VTGRLGKKSLVNGWMGKIADEACFGVTKVIVSVICSLNVWQIMIFGGKMQF